MHRKLPWLGALLVVALIIAYYALTEPVTVIQRTAPDSAIQRNPYSAAQAWLAQRGQPSQRVLSAAALFPLPEEDTTLIIDKQRGLLSHSQVRALLHWVEAGGELIVEARPLPKSRDEDTATETDWQDNDALLYSLGITVWKGEALADEEELDPFFELLDALPAFAGNPCNTACSPTTMNCAKPARRWPVRPRHNRSPCCCMPAMTSPPVASSCIASMYSGTTAGTRKTPRQSFSPSGRWK